MIVRVIVFLLGVLGTGWILTSIVRSVVIPRPERVWLTVSLFNMGRWIAHTIGNRLPARQRHRILGAFAPAILIGLPLIWSAGLLVAFACMYWSIDVGSWQASLEFSGSSLTTLGFLPAPNSTARALAVAEALLGLGIVALMISFLPALYGTFSRREISVGKLTTRAGAPPDPVTFLTRLKSIDRLDHIDASWGEWEDWFVELDETHTSFPALVYFRSASPDRSWLRSAETALDTAAVVKALHMHGASGEADLLIRSGARALRSIADFYRIEPEGTGTDYEHLSVSETQFDDVVDQLIDAGVTTRPVPTTAWETFAGWRNQYDRAIVGLEHLIEDLPGYWESNETIEASRG